MCNTKEWDKKNILNFIFEMAFRDATLRNAFVNPYKIENKKAGKTDKKGEKDAENKFVDLKNEIRKKTKELVKNYLKLILENESPLEESDNCRYQCMMDIINGLKESNDKIKKTAPEHKGFTFGNVQKLVNMSAKYLYIACYANPEMRKRFNVCDCPMDSIMIKGVVSEAQRNNEFERLRKETSWSSLAITDGNNTEIKKFIDLIPKEYVEFQQWIRGHKDKDENMLDYDFRRWAEWSEEY